MCLVCILILLLLLILYFVYKEQTVYMYVCRIKMAFEFCIYKQFILPRNNTEEECQQLLLKFNFNDT